VSPTILHNNVDEIEKSLGLSIKSEDDMIDFLKYLQSKNIKQLFITNGAKPTYASNLDYHYKVTNPKIEAIDSTGSGDSFVAGVAYGWHNNFPFEELLFFASALGVVNAAKYDVCNVSIDEAEQVKSRIQIQSIGKKMRLVDDKPS
jgi:fructose-1-phosphate kinase PfkB-like protein